jgi:hypothetical protein
VLQQYLAWNSFGGRMKNEEKKNSAYVTPNFVNIAGYLICNLSGF